MGYLGSGGIPNLYKNRSVIDLFKEVYAMEKIHGTSASVIWSVDNGLSFFPGGEKYNRFLAIFGEVESFIDAGGQKQYRLVAEDHEAWEEKFKAVGVEKIRVFGEAYGGKCQGMSDTYGKELKFIAFEVKIGDLWLNVPKAEKVATDLGFEFVHYVRGPATEEFVNEQRDKPSTQAKRNGIEEDKKSEGIIIRPLIELTMNNGKRLMAKHKRDDFRETRTPRSLDPEKQKVLSDAKEIADEWVTVNRLDHVIDQLKIAGAFDKDPIEDEFIIDMSATSKVIKEMLEDIKKESEGEIEWSKPVSSAIGKNTAIMFKQRLKNLSVKV